MKYEIKDHNTVVFTVEGWDELNTLYQDLEPGSPFEAIVDEAIEQYTDNYPAEVWR